VIQSFLLLIDVAVKTSIRASRGEGMLFFYTSLFNLFIYTTGLLFYPHTLFLTYKGKDKGIQIFKTLIK
jgi:hypothetical protein